jgi:hypothetical protein
MLPEHTCTPGRVAWVYFTHRDVVLKLEGKPKDWVILGQKK